MNILFSQINVLLTQFTYEISRIFEIIQAARVGQIHSNLLNQDQLLTQFKDIKLYIPVEQIYP